ncbi:RNA polymerase II transcriptional coactivator KELP-like [Typha angustifolia]|uniref:RNA polymerase II transcriptional coactivator KELP-like n=1 Tax=Typha angustifolia TaxID=59011 RepID=UPI003C2B4BCA
MDTEMQRRIEATVVEILKEADMEAATEYKVRTMAAEKLGIDLSLPERKRFVRGVVESFLLSRTNEEVERREEQPQGNEREEEEKEEEEEEEEEEENTKGGRGRKKEYDDDGDLIICRLSNKRRVTLQEFRGKMLVSIREFYEKDGKQLPSSKGISLTVDQWEAFRDAVPAIEDAIKKLEGSD